MSKDLTPVQFARRLRRRATISEKILWLLLRDRQLEGFKFRRQHPIPPYTADFVCMKNRLVVECDGVTHAEQHYYDAERDQYLVSLGYRIVRFTDEFIQGNPDRVVAQIAQFLPSRAKPPALVESAHVR